MLLFKKAAVVGTGLIGGSMALALKKKRLVGVIVGVSRRKQNIEIAIKRKIIDRGASSLGIIKEADLVILATPVDAALRLAPDISKLIRKECLVIDVCSTKEKITSSLDKVFHNYVGTHPLAGSEKKGVINSDKNLFDNSLCIITPTQMTKRKNIIKAARLWEALGARTIFVGAAKHDKILSFVSHLPHLVAFSLVNSIPKEYFKFASSGLRDTTRIAASGHELWADIILNNRRNTLRATEEFQRELTRIKSAIVKKDKRQLVSILKKSQLRRQAL